jgi:hypothetical protein
MQKHGVPVRRGSYGSQSSHTRSLASEVSTVVPLPASHERLCVVCVCVCVCVCELCVCVCVCV